MFRKAQAKGHRHQNSLLPPPLRPPCFPPLAPPRTPSTTRNPDAILDHFLDLGGRVALDETLEMHKDDPHM